MRRYLIPALVAANIALAAVADTLSDVRVLGLYTSGGSSGGARASCGACAGCRRHRSSRS
jgi:hypothetical protein